MVPFGETFVCSIATRVRTMQYTLNSTGTQTMQYTLNTTGTHLHLLLPITRIEFIIGSLTFKILFHFELPGPVSAKDVLSQKILNTFEDIKVTELLIASHSVSSLSFMPFRNALHVFHLIKQFLHRIRRLERGRNDLMIDYRAEKLINL